MTVAFTVHGLAAPAGSKKGFVNKRTGKVIITDASKRSKPWQNDVAHAALDAMADRPPLEGALELAVTFHMPRPKGHYGTGRNAGVIKPTAPAFPTVKPDATKLLRALEDACTGVVWRDDAQIVTQHIRKVYGKPPRAIVGVVPIHPPEPERKPT